jgi:uncharacterized protein (DUF1330 family)
VSIWLRDGDVAGFEAFERKIAGIQAKHGGRIERAIRLAGADAGAANPFEVHVVSFPDAASLAAYRADPQMRELAAERERVIGRTVIAEGFEAGPY